MNWEAIGAVGEIVGALGVIATLLYLSRQVRRSDETARAESLRVLLDGHRDRSVVHGFASPEVSDLLAKGLTDFKSLSASEKRQFFFLFSEQVFQTQQAMQLHGRGLLPRVDFEAWLFSTATLIQTPGGTQCWEILARSITPTIRVVIDEHLAANPDTPSFLELNPLFRYET